MNIKRSKWQVLLGIGAGILVVLIISLAINIDNLIPKSSIAPESEQARPDMNSDGMADDVAESESQFDATDYDSMEQNLDRKLIKTAELKLESLNLDGTIDDLTREIKALDGYIKSSAIEGTSRHGGDRSKRHANFTIKIPTDNLDKCINSIGHMGDLIHEQIYAEDITAQYFDTEARLKSLEIQEERLLTILSEAKDLQDIIELERQLSKVRYEIENYTKTLKKWNSLMDYSTIYISIMEVERLIPDLEGNFSKRVSIGFVRSIKNLGNLFENIAAIMIIWSPYILILGALMWVVRFIFLNKRTK